MVSSTRQAIACILVSLSAVIFARAQTVQPKDATSTISGKVTVKGKAAPGIFINLRKQENSSPRQPTGFRATTDSEGKYRIENVTAGSYAVVPVALAYISDDIAGERLLIVKPGETIENVDFALVRGGAITGKVVDSDGRPLVEEEVVAIPEKQQFASQMRYLGTGTDDRGVYRIFGLAPGRYKVAAGTESFAPYQRSSFKRSYHPGVDDQAQAVFIEVEEGSETTNIDFTLGGAVSRYSASGRIIDSQIGQPMPNVHYHMTRYYDENSSASTHSNTPTNSRGEFRLENLSPGKYGIEVQDRTNGEWRAEELLFEVVDHDVTGLVIKTEKAASISGVVILEGADEKTAREQLTKAHLSASIMKEINTGRGFGSSTMPAKDGSFRIAGLSGGMASLWLHSETMQFRVVRVERNGVIQPRGIDIKPSEQVTGVRVIVNSGNASLRGTIVAENGTMPAGGRFFVWLRRVEEGNTSISWGSAQPQLDSRGQFQVDNMFPGTYEIHAGVAVQMSEGRTQMIPNKKQEVVVTAGINNVTVTLDLSSATPRP